MAVGENLLTIKFNGFSQTFLLNSGGKKALEWQIPFLKDGCRLIYLEDFDRLKQPKYGGQNALFCLQRQNALFCLMCNTIVSKFNYLVKPLDSANVELQYRKFRLLAAPLWVCIMGMCRVQMGWFRYDIY